MCIFFSQIERMRDKIKKPHQTINWERRGDSNRKYTSILNTSTVHIRNLSLIFFFLLLYIPVHFQSFVESCIQNSQHSIEARGHKTANVIPHSNDLLRSPNHYLQLCKLCLLNTLFKLYVFYLSILFGLCCCSTSIIIWLLVFFFSSLSNIITWAFLNSTYYTLK